MFSTVSSLISFSVDVILLVSILIGFQGGFPQWGGLPVLALKMPRCPGMEGQGLPQPAHHALLLHLSLHDVGENEVFFELLYGVLLFHPVQTLMDSVPRNPPVVFL